MASEKVTALIEEVKALSVLELADLVHALEDAFGVSAAAVSSCENVSLVVLLVPGTSAAAVSDVSSCENDCLVVLLVPDTPV